jgi:hypothetical protein
MIKKSLIVASLLFITTSALALDTNKLYIGIGTTTGSGTLTRTSTNGGYASADYDSSSTPFKIGYIFKNNNRFEFSVESMDHKFSGGTDTVSGWNMDWDFAYPNHKLADIITPYWTIGFGSYTYEDTAKYFSDNEDLKGLALNYGIGGLYSINNNFEIEASFKGKVIKWQDVTDGTTTVSYDSTGTAMYLGINYKF